MEATHALVRDMIKHPINISSKRFIEHTNAYYQWLREEAPVYKGKLSVLTVYLLSRYNDCVELLMDRRFVRNRTTVTGGKNRVPFPVPKAISLVAQNMILADEGQQLSEDELVSMVLLLILAGFETTVHLITNAVVTLLLHPVQLQRLRDQPDLMSSAVEEIVRYNGPVQSTKPAYASQAITLHGVTIPRGAMVLPLLGAANRDPAVFERPEVFDIARTPNRHLGFGQGIHYCLGAPLARMETRIALQTLLKRNPNLRLAVEPKALKLQTIPTWHRYERLPVVLG